ncbi:uncharacterized protein BJ212DRAFT_1320125 [Suillus subaureus]|uniref:Uncharacterized protein n=1 Tax=Suillus subaureus TaxID=48587 RepID=A0A9P7EK51_9AGAM|nr:uncharacterized protein BJ212DRAFT_1320125 [Suillus subaureus]KAG1824436.1 hypothetical protein BJ212DRAFT_1320125 [Suillus subaureus]
MIQFSRARPTWQTVLLVRPWNRYLLELPVFAGLSDFGDDTESEDGYWSAPGSPIDESRRGSPVEEELPFSALLLAQQRGGEYMRIASDHDIIAQVKDMASVDNMMDVRTLEIL